MTLQQPLWLLLAVLLPLVFVFWRRRGHVIFSDTRLVRRSLIAKGLQLAAEAMFALALLAGLIALANPTVPDEPSTKTILGRDLIIAVDVSASMGFEFKGSLAKLETAPGLDGQVPVSELKREKPGGGIDPNKLGSDTPGLRRIDAAQRAILTFIRDRYLAKNGDRIGMITFDDRPRIAWPLSHDLRMIYRQAQFIDKTLGLGTNFGGRPPGPLDLAITQFEELGQATNKVIILVTDGEDDLDGYVQRRLVELLKKNNVRLYLVGVGETLAKNDVDIMKVATSVGGRVFRVEDAKSMQECFATIDSLERSAVTYEQVEEHKTVFFYFAMAAAALLALGVIIEFVVINQ
jgi:Mg-chelatase subunit ChlD